MVALATLLPGLAFGDSVDAGFTAAKEIKIEDFRARANANREKSKEEAFIQQAEKSMSEIKANVIVLKNLALKNQRG